jgi:hypothetical protein
MFLSRNFSEKLARVTTDYQFISKFSDLNDRGTRGYGNRLDLIAAIFRVPICAVIRSVGDLVD